MSDFGGKQIRLVKCLKEMGSMYAVLLLVVSLFNYVWLCVFEALRKIRA